MKRVKTLDGRMVPEHRIDKETGVEYGLFAPDDPMGIAIKAARLQPNSGALNPCPSMSDARHMVEKETMRKCRHLIAGR